MNRERAKALLQKKNVRSAALVSALVVTLVATVVSGREKPATDGVVEPSVRAASQASVAQSPSPNDLDLDRLRRVQKDAPIADLFGPADPERGRASGDAVAGANSAPVETPIPFQYLGRVIDDGRTSVFLALAGEPYSVQEGQTIDQYRVDKVGDADITFTHLPTGTRKVLAVPALN